LIGNQLHLKYVNPNFPLKEIKANPETPGESFGNTGTFQSNETIHWIEETFEVCPSVTYDIWDELYRSIRCGKAYPIHIDEALEVMRIISEVKRGTNFE
jgi:molybdopterin/thiamine biosynthesis adenylyltransferase